MKTILVDLNVLLDFLFKRKYFDVAQTVVEMCDSKEVKGFLCSHEITTLSYFLEKECKDKAKNQFVIGEILDIFDILYADKATLKKALVSKVSDFEDAVIVESCKENDIDYIVTRNIRAPLKTPRRHLRAPQFLPCRVVVSRHTLRVWLLPSPCRTKKLAANLTTISF